MQGGFALKHLNLLLTSLYLDLVRLKLDLAASDNDIHVAISSPDIFSQPQVFVVDISGLGIILFPYSYL